MFTGCLWPWREGLETQKKIQKSKKHFKDILIWFCIFQRARNASIGKATIFYFVKFFRVALMSTIIK